MSVALLIFDVDDTLSHARPVVGSFEEWERSIAADHPPPMARALVEVPRILAEHGDATVAILTARHVRTQGATWRFVSGHFPSLAERCRHLSMQTTAQFDAWKASGVSVAEGFAWSRRSKIERLAELRRRFPGKCLLVDDDEKLRDAVGPGEFLRAWE